MFKGQTGRGHRDRRAVLISGGTCARLQRMHLQWAHREPIRHGRRSLARMLLSPAV